jgi:hypothetical protein
LARRRSRVYHRYLASSCIRLYSLLLVILGTSSALRQRVQRRHKFKARCADIDASKNSSRSRRPMGR